MTTRDQIHKWFFYALGLFLVWVLDAQILNRLPVLGTIPMLLPLAVVSVAVNLLLPQSGLWSLFVLAGIGCLWISLAIAIRKRHNIPKNMLYQVVVISGLSALWDWLTGWRGWSIDYVIPIVCVCAMAALGILSRVMKWQISDLLVYFCLDGVFGIVPIIFYITGCLHVPYPSIVCVAVSVISLAAILLFAVSYTHLTLPTIA